MKVVLTGASGFLGRHVLNCLVQNNIDVVSLGRSRPQGYVGEHLSVDLCRSEGLPKLAGLGATHLMHLAWYVKHGNYWGAIENAQWVVATHALIADFCSAGGEKVVAAGTCAEYDWSDGLCSEDETALAPASIYGTAKSLARAYTEQVCRTGQVSWAWGRVFVPVGPGENRNRLLPSLMDVFAGKRAPFAVGLTTERDFLRVEDVASAFVQMLEPAAIGCYNICSGHATPIGEVVERIAAMYGRDPKLIPASICAETAPRVVGDSRRLRALGWAPQITLADSLQPGKGW
jgi:nucleoside-diphosphate-sugar epimerase